MHRVVVNKKQEIKWIIRKNIKKLQKKRAMRNHSICERNLIRQTHLYGAKLEGIHPWYSFIFEVSKDGRLQIIHICKTDYDPVIIVFAERNKGSTYALKAKDAIKSKAFMNRLSQSDRDSITRLASLNLPKSNYSTWHHIKLYIPLNECCKEV